VHVDDLAGMALWAVEKESIAGPLDAVMPLPVTNAEFTRLLGRAVRRPAILPAPAFLLRAILGEMSSLLLDSSRVLPQVACARDYRYEFADVAAAVDDVAR
jgi:NAD dependent epimerase/dehydratase family enzyme